MFVSFCAVSRIEYPIANFEGPLLHPAAQGPRWPAVHFEDQLILENMAPTGIRGSYENNRISEEQMVKILREADAAPAQDAVATTEYQICPHNLMQF